MEDPYLIFTENEISNWRGYYEYFHSLCRHTRNISLNEREEWYLSYFIKNPASSAYDIQPGNKINHKNYRYAKLALNKFRNLGLVELIKSGKARKKGRHPSKECSLTDHGIFYVLFHTKIDMLQELFRNYQNSMIFRYLIYPFMNLETLCSQRLEHHFLTGVEMYLVNLFQRMDQKFSSFERRDKSNKEIFFWKYNKLEDYLRKSFNYEFIDFLYSEEYFDDRYQEITYFDEKNKTNYVTIKYDKISKKALVYRKNKRIRKYEIPFAADYLTRKVIPYKIDIARRFHTLCGPKVEEFILSVFPFFKVASEDNIRDLIANDRQFRDALKTTKHTFDAWYDRIMSFSNFLS